MKTLLCFLSLLICLCIAQRTAFNDFSDWRYARCVNATPGDTICFNSLSWIYPSWTIFPNEPNFITDVGEDVDPQYRDFCNSEYLLSHTMTHYYRSYRKRYGEWF